MCCEGVHFGMHFCGVPQYSVFLEAQCDGREVSMTLKRGAIEEF